MEAAQESPESGTHSRNHFLWLGPVIAVPGFLSYYGFFVQWAVFRDTAWLNIGILLGATAISLLGLLRAWPRGIGWRAAGVVSTGVSGFLTGLLIVYCYGLSYGLPSADLAALEGQRIPSVTLASYDGTEIDVGLATDQPLILVFYRGFW